MPKTEQEIEELAAQAHENVMAVVREAKNDPQNGQIRIDVAARREFRRIYRLGHADSTLERLPKS
jgi:hypothetical protein